MTYVPTTWILNSAPALTAIQLNRIEHGIDIAQGDVMVLYGLTAAIPASDAELVGRLYFETDGGQRVLRDNGTTWDVVLSRHLLVTGQTTQYGGYDDDGFYERGITKDYTVLTLGAYAGNTNITLNAKVEAHSNNCVQDNVTGLMWSRTVSGPNVGPANDGLLPWTTNGAGEGIFTYVAAANAAALAGHADWRVPNAFELFSLVNEEVANGMPDPVAFPVWVVAGNRQVWTSTTSPPNTTRGVEVGFLYGAAGHQNFATLKTGTHVCALVRL